MSGLPRKRATPRRTRNPLRPAWEVQPDGPDVDEPTGSHADLEAFRTAVRTANVAGRDRCVGTPWCETPGVPHRGHHAHHIHPQHKGGTNHPLNGVWICFKAHLDGVHNARHRAEALALGLLATTSPPWPEP